MQNFSIRWMVLKLQQAMSSRVKLLTISDGSNDPDGGGGGGVSDLESVVECPVCLVIPRDLPIPCCPAGHIICRPCRGRVLHCPTCRRQLGDNTSSLAAALIERVKHK